MKKILYIILLFTVMFTSGCHTANQKLKGRMLNEYCNEENYISLQGEVTKIESENSKFVTIRCEGLTSYIDCLDGEIECWICSNHQIILNVGDHIDFTTVPIQFYDNQKLPIVAISQNETVLLNLEEGKDNLIEWVNQLQSK